MDVENQKMLLYIWMNQKSIKLNGERKVNIDQDITNERMV